MLLRKRKTQCSSTSERKRHISGALQIPGNIIDISEELELLVCRMYAQSSDVCDVNDLRYLLFCTKSSEMQSSPLPPFRDCLQMHIHREDYQAAVWRQCLEGQPDIPEPSGHGWKTDDKGMLLIDSVNLCLSSCSNTATVYVISRHLGTLVK